MSFYPKKINKVDVGILKKVRKSLYNGHVFLRKTVEELAYSHGNSSVADALHDNKQRNVYRRTAALEKKLETIREEVETLYNQIDEVIDEDGSK